MIARDGGHGTKRPLRLLIIEDREDDLLLLLGELDRAGYAVSHTHIDRLPDLQRALATDNQWDLVVSDFSLPAMTAHDVLATLQRTRPDLPCIVVSGTISEEAAVDVLKAGARDFVVKQRMARLVPAIQRELRESDERRRLLDAERALHQMRKRMQFAIESVGVGFWDWDLRSGVVVWSDVQERLHGLEPGTFAGSFDALVATIHPEDRVELLRRAQQWQHVGGDTRTEYRSVWPDGSVHWILSIGRTIAEEPRKPRRATGIAMDITSQKQLEDQFRQAQRMESIGNLAGGIAHDFNNLLTIISGCCDLAATGVPAGSELSESLEGIRGAAVSASALTRRLLTFSRRQVVSPRVLNLEDTIAGFRPILRRLVEENIQIEFDLPASQHLVSADPSQIEQVLLNLVANARDAMPSGGSLTIATRDATEDDRSRIPPDGSDRAYVVLSVADTGAGMSPEVLSHVFEPFFTTKPVGQGTGLGLATVYGIVKQSDGHIALISAPGSGTRVYIYLPVVSTSVDHPAEARPVSPLTSGGATVLVVEDTAPLRRLTKKMLERAGYTVLVATDGREAQEICTGHSGPIPVVLIDVVLPGDSGPVVGEWIRARRPEARIILTSGYTGGGPGQDRVLQPGTAFLPKPFDARQLARAVGEALAASESPQHN